LLMIICDSFFFQAEDGIRDRNVTGVQTCALPILETVHQPFRVMGVQKIEKDIVVLLHIHSITAVHHVFKLFFSHRLIQKEIMDRSEERRVGKECRCRWWAQQYRKRENKVGMVREE